MRKFFASVAFAALLSSGAMLPAGAMAQTPPAAPVTPDTISPTGADQVEQRLQNQQNRINQGVANGTITPDEASRDEARDANIANHLSADEAKNGGQITTGEQKRLNHRLHKNSKHIRHQAHHHGRHHHRHHGHHHRHHHADAPAAQAPVTTPSP